MPAPTFRPGLTDTPSWGTFAAGQLKDTGNTTASITLASHRFTEIEFAVQATSNATAGGDYCFQLYNATSSAVLNGYTYAQARVSGTTAISLMSLGQLEKRFRGTCSVGRRRRRRRTRGSSFTGGPESQRAVGEAQRQR